MIERFVVGKKVSKYINRKLYKRGYRLCKVGRINFFEQLLDSLIKKKGKVFFIQIGANDGKSFDPVYDFVMSYPDSFKGILLEPLEDYFDELLKNYKGYKNVTLLNMAIHNTNEEMTIHRVDPEKIKKNELPEWTKGIASFNQEHHKLSGTPDQVMIKQTVKCISLSGLLKKYNIDKLELLQIDTEGYDAEIIRDIDFSQVKPAIIHFEHGVAQGIMSKDDFNDLACHLHENGYEIWLDEFDATAYQREVIFRF